MISRRATGLALCAFSLTCLGSLSPVSAQSPFTIRRPKDGTTVREKLRVEIPRGSIHAGGYVALYIDENFQIALPPEDDEEGSDKPFVYIWDTKGSGVSDGEHTLRTILYEPSAGSGVTEAARSEVRVTVANKITDGPSALLLRYRYREGDNLEYSRDGKAVAIGALSESGKIGDESLGSVKGKLRLSVEDARFDSEAQSNIYLVRNKLTGLSILNGNQEQVFEPSQLSHSMYQEILPDGRIQYETGDRTGEQEFTSLGLPVNNTLELPLLPTLEVSVGGEWKTQNQRVDVPGLSPSHQPRVTLSNKLEDLEWEGGRRTAKIHQTYEGPLKEKTIQFGQVDVTSPQVKFARDVYIAYDSGLLIRMVRTLTISGRSTSPVGAPPQQPGAVSGPNTPRFGPPGAMGSEVGSGPPTVSSGVIFKAPGQGGGQGAGEYSPAGGPGPYNPGGPPPAYLGSSSGYAGAGDTGIAPHAVTLRSTTETELLPTSIIGVGVSRGTATVAARPSHTRTVKSRKH